MKLREDFSSITNSQYLLGIFQEPDFNVGQTGIACAHRAYSLNPCCPIEMSAVVEMFFLIALDNTVATIHMWLLAKIPSLTKFYSGSPEFSNQVSTFRLLWSSLNCPILAIILLSWFSHNLPSSISDHPQYLIRFAIYHQPQVDV